MSKFKEGDMVTCWACSGEGVVLATDIVDTNHKGCILVKFECSYGSGYNLYRADGSCFGEAQNDRIVKVCDKKAITKETIVEIVTAVCDRLNIK